MSFTLQNPMFKAPDRRYKIMRMLVELFFELHFNPLLAQDVYPKFPEVRAVSVEGLPDDVQIVAIAYDGISPNVMVRLWSSQFVPLLSNQAIPECDVQCTERRFRLVGSRVEEDNAVREQCAKMMESLITDPLTAHMAAIQIRGSKENAATSLLAIKEVDHKSLRIERDNDIREQCAKIAESSWTYPNLSYRGQPILPSEVVKSAASKIRESKESQDMTVAEYLMLPVSLNNPECITAAKEVMASTELHQEIDDAMEMPTGDELRESGCIPFECGRYVTNKSTYTVDGYLRDRTELGLHSLAVFVMNSVPRMPLSAINSNEGWFYLENVLKPFGVVCRAVGENGRAELRSNGVYEWIKPTSEDVFVGQPSPGAKVDLDNKTVTFTPVTFDAKPLLMGEASHPVHHTGNMSCSTKKLEVGYSVVSSHGEDITCQECRDKLTVWHFCIEFGFPVCGSHRSPEDGLTGDVKRTTCQACLSVLNELQNKAKR